MIVYLILGILGAGFLISMIFTDSSMVMCILGLLLCAGGIVCKAFLAAKLKKGWNRALQIILPAAAVLVGLFTFASDGDGTLMARAKAAERVYQVTSGNDLEAAKTFLENYYDTYGENDNVALTAAEGYLSVVKALRDKDSDTADEYYWAGSDQLNYHVENKRSKKYYLLQGEYYLYGGSSWMYWQVEHWQQAVEDYPDWGEAHMMVAMALAEEDSLNYAMREYYLKLALELEPDNAYAAAELGRVYFEQGYYDHAGACYTMAKEIGAGNDYIEGMADFYLRAIEEVQK